MQPGMRSTALCGGGNKELLSSFETSTGQLNTAEPVSSSPAESHAALRMGS